MRYIRLIATFLPVLLWPGRIDAQTETALEDARARMVTLLNQGAYAAGCLEGQKMLEDFPEDPMLRALYIAHFLRLPLLPTRDRAVTMADAMAQAAPDNPWSMYAQASVLPDDRYEEAVDAGKKALALLPDNPVIIQGHAEVLARRRYQEAIAFVDACLDRASHPAELLAIKARAQYRLAEDDAVKQAAAFDTFARARALDPSNVNAHYLAGEYLMNAGKREEAYLLLARAFELSPGNFNALSRLLMTIQMVASIEPDRKQDLINAHIERMLSVMGENIHGIYWAFIFYGQFGFPERQQNFGERILQQAPDGPYAEWVLVERYRAAARAIPSSDGGAQSLQTGQVRQMLEAFIARPHHHNTDLLGDAYRTLFNVIEKDPGIDPETLLRVVQGMAKYETMNPHVAFAAGAIALAEKTTCYHEAEQIARDGIPAVRRKIESQRAFYKTQEDYEQAINRLTGLMYDALGWVFYHEGRLGDAERELTRAYALNQNDRNICYHLGRLFEARHNNEQAELFYQRGLAVKYPGVNPCEQALETLYEKMRGSMDGYDAYLARLQDTDSLQRKEAALAARIADPKPVKPFALRTLDGSRLLSDDLTGKITVINFWGIWCGWCLHEMPDFQKLYEQYRDDPGVMILTINNDRDPDSVPSWMKDNGYTFPVLFDDSYVNTAGVRAFPTTWFIDPQGRIAFEKIGWTRELVEEFGWRIEALREEVRE